MKSTISKIAQRIFNRSVFTIAKFRGIFWGFFTKDMGKSVSIFSSCKIASPSGVTLGNYVTVGSNTVLSGAGGLSIGNYVMIGTNCNILTSQHKFNDTKLPMMMQGVVLGKIVIEDDVWIGANVVVLPDVTIGSGAVVGANSVVNKNVEPRTVVAGVPAKFIKKRT